MATATGRWRACCTRLRFALELDDDLRPFHERFRWDPLIGRALRSDPCLRVRRRPEPFEAVASAVCAQLIESERAFEIQRRIVARLGRGGVRTPGCVTPQARRGWPAPRRRCFTRWTCPPGARSR
jgi:3-methyladenine DNA glycosylase/8-oxoguanine DNA glycosylase